MVWGIWCEVLSVRYSVWGTQCGVFSVGYSVSWEVRWWTETLGMKILAVTGDDKSKV